MENMTQKDKLFSYLTMRGYEKKWGDIYRQIREELKSLGVTDPSRVTEYTPRLMSLRMEIQELMRKMRNESKFFGFDTETELSELMDDFVTDIATQIDEEIPLG